MYWLELCALKLQNETPERVLTRRSWRGWLRQAARKSCTASGEGWRLVGVSRRRSRRGSALFVGFEVERFSPVCASYFPHHDLSSKCHFILNYDRRSIKWLATAVILVCRDAWTQNTAMMTFFILSWTKWSKNLMLSIERFKVSTPFCPKMNKKCQHSSFLHWSISTNVYDGCYQPFNQTRVLIQNKVTFQR